jgi:hypothetical protein
VSVVVSFFVDVSSASGNETGIDEAKVARADEHLGRRSRDRRDLGIDEREAEVDRPRDAQPAHVQGLDRVGVPDRRCRQRSSVATIRT